MTNPMTDEELAAIETRQKKATPEGRVLFDPDIREIMNKDVPALIAEVRRLRDQEAMMKRCACEFPEIDPCDVNCSCRNRLMSGGCGRCATYGSPEQQLASARHIADILTSFNCGEPQ